VPEAPRPTEPGRTVRLRDGRAVQLNYRMLHLIGELGLVGERSLDQGVVSLRFKRRPDRESRPAGRAPYIGC